MLKLTLSTNEDIFSTAVESIEDAGCAVREAVLTLELSPGEVGRFELYDEAGNYMGWISCRGRFWKAG